MVRRWPQWHVRRFFGHSDRLIVLPEKPRRPRANEPPGTPPAPFEPDTTPKLINAAPPPLTEKRHCPDCLREVRYNLARGQYYSHCLPESADNCERSGRP